MRPRSLRAWCSVAVRAAAGVVAIRRLAGATHAAVPVRPTLTPRTSISVVVPARDEARRIGPLLDAVVGAPGVDEVVVVDDESSDATAELAATAGARVVHGVPLPDGWAGKAWALRQGVEAARGDWIVTLDADTRPDHRLPSAAVARAIGDRLDLLTLAGGFDCPTTGAQWLHPAMLTTLVYRFGVPGVSTAAQRTMANGQCMVARRSTLLDGELLDAVHGEVVEDVALARHVASTGGRVAFLDAGELLTVRMFESFADAWRGWSRSLALPGVDPPRRQLLDLAVVLAAQVAPLPRLLAGRADLVDAVLLACRLGTLVGTRRAYCAATSPTARLAYWLSPVADPIAAAALAAGIRRGGTQVWRGRHYSGTR